MGRFGVRDLGALKAAAPSGYGAGEHRNRPPMRELFPKVTAPVLILKADAQGDLRRENEEVAGLLKKGRIVHIEGAAHNVRRDQKQKTLASSSKDSSQASETLRNEHGRVRQSARPRV